MTSNIDASIIDQHVNSVVERLRLDIKQRIGSGANDHRVKSAAFAMIALQHSQSIDEQSALDSLTDGGNDAGVDALHIGDVTDNEFVVTIVQSKYSHELDGRSGYSANSIVRVIQTIRQIFNQKNKVAANSRLSEKITEVRSLLLDRYIPEVHVVLCNNGKKWEANGEQEIENSGLRSEGVSFSYVNHSIIMGFLQSRKPISATLKLMGKAFVENYNLRRVLIGKMPVLEVKGLFDEAGDRLLERNIRRFLGLRENRVNSGIHTTLLDERKREDFYFFNNGITAICSKFSHTGLKDEDWVVTIDGLQIVNGGQTCKTIQKTIQEDPGNDYSKACVLLRLYEISTKDDVAENITLATNSQSPVDVSDLHSNDVMQEKLAIGLSSLGYEYKRKRDDVVTVVPGVITASVAAESVMAVWRRQPNSAKFRRSRLFSAFYNEIFSEDLQASHVLISVLVFRLVENERKRPRKARPSFVPYASHFLSMVVGDLLLDAAALRREDVNHTNIGVLTSLLEGNKNQLYEQALRKVGDGLRKLGIDRSAPLPRVAAQFRRGDLFEQVDTSSSPNRRKTPKKDRAKVSSRSSSARRSSNAGRKKLVG